LYVLPLAPRLPSLTAQQAANRVSDKAKKTLDLVKKFVEERCIPCVATLVPYSSAPTVANNHRCDPVVAAQINEAPNRWDTHPSVIEDLKEEAKKLGLWNMFLPKGHYKESPGFTNLEYGLMAEWLGKSRVASEAVNCAAPDTGNMEVLAKYGNEAQKAQWLKPLMEGKIRSAFLMTEPDVASSDATNIQLSMRKEGNEWVLNGQVRLHIIPGVGSG
jgi:acyl-CoA dehydrogenase